MTKEEIYEHLAKVYIGKKQKKKKGDSLLIKTLFFVSLLFFISALFFVITGSNFLIKRRSVENKQNLLSLSLGNYPLRLSYNFDKDNPQRQNFSMYLPNLDLRQFDSLVFSIRGLEDRVPRLLKIGLENKRREKSRFYFDDITYKWKKVIIPLDKFKEITDWSQITKISFIFEAWNLDTLEGKVLIDGVSFSSKRSNDPAAFLQNARGGGI